MRSWRRQATGSDAPNRFAPRHRPPALDADTSAVAQNGETLPRRERAPGAPPAGRKAVVRGVVLAHLHRSKYGLPREIDTSERGFDHRRGEHPLCLRRLPPRDPPEHRGGRTPRVPAREDGVTLP